MSTVAVVIGAGLLSLGVEPVGAVASGSISGTVTVAGGRRQSQGICVSLYSDGWWTGRGLLGTATTAADGTYTLSGISDGTYDVSFDATGICPAGSSPTTSPSGEQRFDPSQSTVISITSGGSVTGIDAAMVQGGSISGTVTAASGGAPIQGVCVSAHVTGGGPAGGSGERPPQRMAPTPSRGWTRPTPTR